MFNANFQLYRGVAFWKQICDERWQIDSSFLSLFYFVHYYNISKQLAIHKHIFTALWFWKQKYDIFLRIWIYLTANRINHDKLCLQNLIWGWSWLHGSWIYIYPCNDCLSALKLWARIPAHGDMYSIQFYVTKFASDLRQNGGFLRFIQQ